MNDDFTPNDSPRILILDPIHEDGLALLRQQAQVDVMGDTALSQAELEQRIGNYDAVIGRSRTPLPAAVIEKGERLRVIGRAGVGLDHVDLNAAEAQGVAVVNTPGASSLSVAEHTMALMLALARRLTQADRSLKVGHWAKKEFRGVCLAGKTLGVIGFGRIGKRVTLRAQAFDMHVITNQPRPTSQLEAAEAVEAVDLLALLPAADFVTLHVPLRPENLGLIGAEELALMKPTAYLINTSRGGIVDEEALLAALENGRIAGAGLDVFKDEPDVNPKLVSHPKVIATPHVAANTDDAQRTAALEVAEQVLGVLKR